MAGAQGKSSKGQGIKVIATNPNARRNFFIEECFEAGMVLQGTEIKSLRAQSPNLKDAFVEIRETAVAPNKDGSKKSRTEAFMVNAHIPHYRHGNIWNHDPLRPRKLLLHSLELKKLLGAITRKGKTVVPLQIYLKAGIAKVEIALAKGKKHHDKRQSDREKSDERSMRQALKV